MELLIYSCRYEYFFFCNFCFADSDDDDDLGDLGLLDGGEFIDDDPGEPVCALM